MSKVTIDTSTCVGCGLCEQNCPEVFAVKDDGLAYLKTQDYSSCNLKEVAEQCPVEAIKIE